MNRALLQTVFAVCLVGWVPILSSCDSFDGAVREFDTVAGISDEVPDPATLDYPANVHAWKASVDPDSGDRVPPSALESPSAFARGRILEMSERAAGDIAATGIVVRRLLLVLERDVNALNRIQAIDGLAALTTALGLDVASRLAPRFRESAADRTAAVLDALAEWRLHDFRAAPPSEDSALEARLRNASALAARSGALATVSDDREVLRVLSRVAGAVRSRRLSAFVHRALAEVGANATARALVLACRSADPRMREAGALAVFRSAGGTACLPVLLRVLSRSDGARYRYPLTIQERRTLLRLAAHARGDLLFERFEGDGPRIVDFVYDTIASSGENTEAEGLRLLALETLSLCLGRPIELTRDWADAWWRDLALHGRETDRLDDEPPAAADGDY